MPRRSGDAIPPGLTVPPEHFENLYAAKSDPWDFATSWYERRKYAITMASLPRERYASGFEAGCSIGEMTKLLAPRCDALLGVDCAMAAVRLAREAVGRFDHVTIDRQVLPTELPAGTFDLVVVTEILYYFAPPELSLLLDELVDRLQPGGDFVAAHWRASDKSYGYDGFNVHDRLCQRGDLDVIVHHEDENFVLNVLRRR